MTKYVFNKGSYVYLLHHNNATYNMQSYSQIVNPNLNEDGLKTLATSLKLPSGWTYEAKKFKESIVLETK